MKKQILTLNETMWECGRLMMVHFLSEALKNKQTLTEFLESDNLPLPLLTAFQLIVMKLAGSDAPIPDDFMAAYTTFEKEGVTLQELSDIDMGTIGMVESVITAKDEIKEMITNGN